MSATQIPYSETNHAFAHNNVFWLDVSVSESYEASTRESTMEYLTGHPPKKTLQETTVWKLGSSNYR